MEKAAITHSRTPKGNRRKLFFKAATTKNVALKPVLAKKQEKTTPPKAKVPKPKKKEKVENPVLKPANKEIVSNSKKFQKHKDLAFVEKESKNASILKATEANQAAGKKNQVDVLGTQDTHEFDKIAFKEKVKTTINDSIKEKADAEKIKNEGLDKDFSDDVNKNIGDEKTKAGGEVETASKLPPNPKPDEYTNQDPGKINTPEALTTSQTNPNHQLAPAPRTDEETNFQKDGEAVDFKMQENNVKDDQLATSNEPKFEAAQKTKSDANEKTAELTNQYRQTQNKTISDTQIGGVKKMNAGYQTMLTNNKGKNDAHHKKQLEKQKEELAIRNKVALDLNKMYEATNKEVNRNFFLIDFYIETLFAADINKWSDKFQSEVQALFENNPGWFGRNLLGREGKSDIEIFEIAKTHFIKNMDDPIDRMVTYIGERLAAAAAAVKTGKAEVVKYWDGQTKDVQRIAGDVKKESEAQFNALETSIEEKEESVVEKIKEKYEEALDGLNERFEAGKEAAKSWWERAMDAIAAVINTIIDLKNAIERIADKAAKYASRIIDAPIEFFSNLGEGIGQGFTNFKNNIATHLLTSAIEWLTGTMSEEGIELPKEFNVEGILNLALQILGVSMEKIKKLIIKVIGKKRFEFLEKGVDAGLAAGNKILNIFKILNEKGLAGLWEFIKEEFTDFKEMFIESVKGFIVEAITNEAIKILLSMLSPVSGFIKAAQMIIKFIITLFQNAGRILQIIEGIIDSFGYILDKNFSQAAAFVEKTMAKFLTLAISFLAAVLGLDGIPKKVAKFLKEKVHPKVDKALNKVAEKLNAVVKKVGLDKLIDKSMVAVEKGKGWVEDKKKKVKDTAKKYGDKFLELLGLKKPFKLGKERHTLVFETVGDKPVFGVKSTFTTYHQFLSGIKKWGTPAAYVGRFGKNTPALDANEGGHKIDKDLANYPDHKNLDKRKKWADDHVVMLNNVAHIIENHAEIDASDELENIPSSVSFGGTTDHGYGTLVNAVQLSNNYVQGQDTGEWGDNGSLTESYETVKRHKNANFIRGHLLNGHLGGRVQNFNLTPLTKKANSDHKNYFEQFAKKLVTGKKDRRDTATKKSVINFKVSVDYTAPQTVKNNSTHADGLKIANEINKNGVVPMYLHCEMSELKFDTGTKKLIPTGNPINYKVENKVPDLTDVKN